MKTYNIKNTTDQTIQAHTLIYEKRGLLGLGYSVSSRKENAKYITLAVLSIISIIFIPIAIPLICIHYKRVGAKVMKEDERISSISEKNLPQPIGQNESTEEPASEEEIPVEDIPDIRMDSATDLEENNEKSSIASSGDEIPIEDFRPIQIDEASDSDNQPNEKAYIDQIRESIPQLASELQLDRTMIENYLITDELSPEKYTQKIKRLGIYSAFAKHEIYHEDKDQKKFILKLFALLGENLFNNFRSKKYREELKTIAGYAKTLVTKHQFAPKEIACGLNTLISKRMTSENISHEESFAQIAHACDSIALRNRSRRAAIRKDLHNLLTGEKVA